MTAAPSGAAVTPPSGVFSTITATTTVGCSAGANPMNQPWGAEPGTFSAVPVFPATWTFGIFAPKAKAPGPSTAPTSIAVSARAVSGRITWPIGPGAISRMTWPWLSRTEVA